MSKQQLTRVDYLPKTKPFDHQHEAFMLSRDLPCFAYLMEQGTGKSKVIIDKAAYNFCRGRINALLVVTLNGVHRNWAENEIPAHLPDYVDRRVAVWSSTMRKAEKEALEDLYDPDFKGLRIFCMNVEAFSHKRPLVEARRFMNAFKVYMALDESTVIKTPSAKRTKNVISIGKHAVIRDIATGTPITQGPFDAYSQFGFMDRSILGFSTYTAHKNHFGVFEKGYNSMTQREYDQLISYRNLDDLKQRIAPYSYRKLKKECLDLPDKIYKRWYVEMTPEQKKVYTKLSKEFIAEFGGTEVAAAHMLPRLLKLQQVLSGFFTDEDGNVTEFPHNRIDALMDIIDQVNGKVLIWARFRYDIKAIEKALHDRFGFLSTVTYYGDTDQEDRSEAVRRMQEDPDTRFFVGNPHAAGYGLTITAADTTIYYSNDFSLEVRLQSEDRNHRIGQKNNVTYYDLEIPGSFDSKVIKALRDKKNIANEITGDNPTNWI